MIFLIPAGILLDRFSTKKVILSALFICLAGTVGFALSENFIQAAFSHFLSGIGNAFCFLSCIMFISRWFPLEKQGFVVGVVVTDVFKDAGFTKGPSNAQNEHQEGKSHHVQSDVQGQWTRGGVDDQVRLWVAQQKQAHPADPKDPPGDAMRTKFVRQGPAYGAKHASGQ